MCTSCAHAIGSGRRDQPGRPSDMAFHQVSVLAAQKLAVTGCRVGPGRRPGTCGTAPPPYETGTGQDR